MHISDLGDIWYVAPCLSTSALKRKENGSNLPHALRLQKGQRGHSQSIWLFWIPILSSQCFLKEKGQTLDCLDLRINNNNKTRGYQKLYKWSHRAPAVAYAPSKCELGVECRTWTLTNPQHILTIWKKKNKTCREATSNKPYRVSPP